ncbi:tRNA pseudouridine(38-40) synthase TruA [Glaciecola sp. XM2]|jgi:tRNA pseudouridine38-40 synthase|uniref:tRNA pseudouridine(38-40) synthase TruA n=1 Tax=Glaciecola sp. XM2 TaxID=1914931 RepID=UPI001BDE2CDB|nr:tRNA pseudouridine(38-40) synthase TruA [Glaciecola sp. XM2]MBT1452091.1 tRNA pseudouridine(38-40) synthase TruA [Glaciecola sp. XM2]
MRIALGIEYQGNQYKGWQRQRNAPSVQQHIETSLENILQHPVSVTCAGRTDAGVHATGQVVHFDTEVTRPDKAYTRGMNTLLPNDIAVTWCQSMEDDFHARFSAFSRRYRYVIYNAALRPGVLQPGMTHIYQPLDAQLMHEGAQYLLGEHDFTTFRASYCQSNSPIRTVESVSVYRNGRYVIVDIRANAFLHHMVRNIVGSLLLVGQKEHPPQWMADLLSAHDRTLAAATAKPNGLYLTKVYYPERFDLPAIPLGPLFLED